MFTIKVGDRQLKVKTDSFKKMVSVSFTEGPGREVTCGLRKPKNDVVINSLAARVRAQEH